MIDKHIAITHKMDELLDEIAQDLIPADCVDANAMTLTQSQVMRVSLHILRLRQYLMQSKQDRGV